MVNFTIQTKPFIILTKLHWSVWLGSIVSETYLCHIAPMHHSYFHTYWRYDEPFVQLCKVWLTSTSTTHARLQHQSGLQSNQHVYRIRFTQQINPFLHCFNITVLALANFSSRAAESWSTFTFFFRINCLITMLSLLCVCLTTLTYNCLHVPCLAGPPRPVDS